VFVFHENHGQGHNNYKHITGQCGSWFVVFFECNLACWLLSVIHPIALCHSLQEVNFGKLDCLATSVHQRLDFLFTQAMNQAYKSQEV